MDVLDRCLSAVLPLIDVDRMDDLTIAGSVAFAPADPNGATLAANSLTIAGGAVLAYKALDKELVPTEDRGTLRILATGPDGVGLGYTDRQTRQIEDLLWPILDSGEARLISTNVGNWDPNRSFITVPLADWGQRERSQQEIAAELNTAEQARTLGVRPPG